ncbi:MAG: hypothetical protein ACTSYB_13290 [Candidatus Helarchaeota archaeon]
MALKFDSIVFFHTKCLSRMKRKLTSNSRDSTEILYLYECPECHYFVSCHIQKLEDGTIEIQMVCERCESYMSISPNYMTPQRGVIYYRCYHCLQGIFIHTLMPNLFLKQNF